jgi:hypothetical protein
MFATGLRDDVAVNSSGNSPDDENDALSNTINYSISHLGFHWRATCPHDHT